MTMLVIASIVVWILMPFLVNYAEDESKPEEIQIKTFTPKVAASTSVIEVIKTPREYAAYQWMEDSNERN